MRIRAVTAATGVAAAVALAGCSHIQPSLGEWAITTGHGATSTQNVKAVTAPGHKTYLGNGTTSWYFPASPQSFITGPGDGSDRLQSTPSFTGSGGKSQPGIAMFVHTYVTWEINPAIQRKDKDGSYAVATHFLQFCIRFGCATNSSLNNAANAAKLRSSDPGWINMVDNIFPKAVDAATRKVLTDFQPDIWTSAGESQWPVLAGDIAAQLPHEIANFTSSEEEGQPDYFCGTGSTETDCKPIFVQVTNVTPTDPGIVAAYQLQQQSNYQLTASASRLAVAKELYGPDAYFFLGVKDTITACEAAKTTCTIYMGSPPIHP
jgi:hypothetical protein